MSRAPSPHMVLTLQAGEAIFLTLLGGSVCGSRRQFVVPTDVKRVFSSLELKEAYLQTVQYAENTHDFALFSINSFQRDLVDRSQLATHRRSGQWHQSEFLK